MTRTEQRLRICMPCERASISDDLTEDNGINEYHHHHHFIRSVAVSNSAMQKENLEAEQDTPGSDELLQWP